MRRLVPIVRLALVLVVSACASVPARPPALESAPAAAYRAAVFDAAIYRKANEYPLKAVPPDAHTIRVVTWTPFPGSYPVGQPMALIRDDLWVTLEPEVQEICRRFEPAGRVVQLQQLLGLPPDDRERTFVILEVDVDENFFRPCPDPDPVTATCSRTFPDKVAADHVAWIARKVLDSFQDPGGYPWTRLGYTYDWRPGASDRYGASEYVIRKGATVRPVARYSTARYCQPPG